MKAVVVHQYGGPEVLKFEDYPDPVPGAGEVLVRVAATSVNPIDYKQRAGLTKDFYPIHFPGVIGVDIAGTVAKIGQGVKDFSVGDRVFVMADNTYAELCVVNEAILAKVPEGLDLIRAAALPLVTTTGNQLLLATGIKPGQTVMVVGAAGNVGRSAVFTAKERGAVVIAGVLKRQMDEAKTVGADQVVPTDDDTAIANLPPLDAVADTVGGRTAEKLIAKVKPGGVFATVLKAPQNAAKYPSVKVVAVFSNSTGKRSSSWPKRCETASWSSRSARLCRSVKRPRLKQRQKRVASGRSCWWRDPVAGHARLKEESKMKKDHHGFNLASKPSGDGCVECLKSPGGWWFHLRRCAECGHIGCCDSSPSQHASKHAAATGHPIITSFEPGEDWFFDYEKQKMIKGVELLPPHAHPESQPVPGPAGRVPANWESLLH